MTESRNWKLPFFTIWAGQAVSLLGSNLVQFALIWWLTIHYRQRYRAGYGNHRWLFAYHIPGAFRGRAGGPLAAQVGAHPFG